MRSGRPRARARIRDHRAQQSHQGGARHAFDHRGGGGRVGRAAPAVPGTRRDALIRARARRCGIARHRGERGVQGVRAPRREAPALPIQRQQLERRDPGVGDAAEEPWPQQVLGQGAPEAALGMRGLPALEPQASRGMGLHALALGHDRAAGVVLQPGAQVTDRPGGRGRAGGARRPGARAPARRIRQRSRCACAPDGGRSSVQGARARGDGPPPTPAARSAAGRALV